MAEHGVQAAEKLKVMLLYVNILVAADKKVKLGHCSEQNTDAIVLLLGPSQFYYSLVISFRLISRYYPRFN